jgi:hypothetical protein
VCGAQGGICKYIFLSPVASCFLYKAKDLSAPSHIWRKPDGCLGGTVLRKPTHTSLYLNIGSHHHPSSKQVRALHDQGTFHHKQEFLEVTFRKMSYSDSSGTKS